MANHLIFAEHDGKNLSRSTLSAISAAKKMGGPICGAVLGKGVKNIAEELANYCEKVHWCEHDGLAHRLAQPFAKVLADVAKQNNVSHVWAAATVAGKDLFPRVAVRLGAGMASDIEAVLSESL